MATDHHMIFSRRNALLAVNAAVVRETIRLPELTPVEEAPAAVSGVINLRGKVIPILDLDEYFGRAPGPYSLTDYVVVMGREGPEAGVIVEDIYDVVPIPTGAVEPPVSRGAATGARPRLVTGEARVGGEIIMLLDHEIILEFCGRTLASEVFETGEQLSPRPEPTTGAREIFRQRALDLQAPPDLGDNEGLIAMAVVLLGKEHFGVDLGPVREFSLTGAITPIPCCPEHVVGAMNLRGNILPIVDIRGLLGLPERETDNVPKVIVASTGEDLVGVAVDDIVDIFYLDPSVQHPSPLAIKPECAGYLRGTVPYAGKALTILDLAGILAAGELIVDEEA